jgi:hypothetical protein
MPREELIDGIEISMGGKKWTVPPLTLKQIKKHEAQLKAISTASGTEAVAMADVAVELIHAAMSRNYPELTRDETEDLLDLGNLVAAINAVMGASGLLLGEAVAVAGSR